MSAKRPRSTSSRSARGTSSTFACPETKGSALPEMTTIEKTPAAVPRSATACCTALRVRLMLKLSSRGAAASWPWATLTTVADLGVRHLPLAVQHAGGDGADRQHADHEDDQPGQQHRGGGDPQLQRGAPPLAGPADAVHHCAAQIAPTGERQNAVPRRRSGALSAPPSSTSADGDAGRTGSGDTGYGTGERARRQGRRGQQKPPPSKVAAVRPVSPSPPGRRSAVTPLATPRRSSARSSTAPLTVELPAD